jgi:hypothetical protein
MADAAAQHHGGDSSTDRLAAVDVDDPSSVGWGKDFLRSELRRRRGKLTEVRQVPDPKTKTRSRPKIQDPRPGSTPTNPSRAGRREEERQETSPAPAAVLAG